VLHLLKVLHHLLLLLGLRIKQKRAAGWQQSVCNAQGSQGHDSYQQKTALSTLAHF
jgi:hypothetical protein